MAIISMRKRELVAYFSVYIGVCLSLLRGANGWYVVCDCSISWSYSFVFASKYLAFASKSTKEVEN